MAITSTSDYARFVAIRNARIKQALQNGLRDGLIEVRRLMKTTRNFRDRTGNLRKSIGQPIEVETNAKGVEGRFVIGRRPDAFYAVYVQDKTRFADNALGEAPRLIEGAMAASLDTLGDL